MRHSIDYKTAVELFGEKIKLFKDYYNSSLENDQNVAYKDYFPYQQKLDIVVPYISYFYNIEQNNILCDIDKYETIEKSFFKYAGLCVTYSNPNTIQIREMYSNLKGLKNIINCIISQIESIEKNNALPEIELNEDPVVMKYKEFFINQSSNRYQNYLELAQAVDDLINTYQLSTRYYILQYFSSAIDKFCRMISPLVKIFYNPSENDSDLMSVECEDITTASIDLKSNMGILHASGKSGDIAQRTQVDANTVANDFGNTR